MKGHLPFFILCSIVCNIYCLLNNTALSSFKSKDLQNPIKVVIDDSGSKFVTWNNISKYQIYDKTGKRRCSGTLSYPIMKAIWPSNYNLLIMTFPGKSIYRVEDQYCTQIKQYNFTDQVHEMSFIWRNQLPILLVSNFKGSFQQFNLNTFSNIKTFLSTAFVVDKAMSTIYSSDGSTFYGLQIYNNSLRLQVFDTSLGMGYGALQSSYALTGMTLMKNGKDIMCLATALNGTQTDVIRFTTNLNVNTVVERQRLSLTIGMREDNHMVLIKSISTQIQLINTKDGQTKQNVQYFTNSTFILDGDYKNKTIVLLDDQGNFVTAEYYPTPQPDPVPTPKPQGLPLWEIAAFVVVGLIILTIFILFIFRKKLPPKLRNKLPKWFTGQKDAQSLLSSRQKIQPYFNPQINQQYDERKNQAERYRQPDIVRVSHQSHHDIINDVIANDEPQLQSEISHRGEVVPEQDGPQISNIGPVQDLEEPDDIRMARLARVNSMNADFNNDHIIRNKNEPRGFQQEQQQKPLRRNGQSNRNSIPGEYQGQESDDSNFLIVKR